MQADEIGTNKNLSIEEEKPLSVYKSKVINKYIFYLPAYFCLVLVFLLLKCVPWNRFKFKTDKWKYKWNI